MTNEEQRLQASVEREVHWKRWGPYLSERQWGTVREDYSANGDAWNYFPHDHARSRAYRWGEDGIGGICDRHQHICFALALWNEKDSDPEGTTLRPHESRRKSRRGREGVLLLSRRDAHQFLSEISLQISASGISRTAQLVEENTKRTRHDPEYELIDTGVFRESRYFDVFVEYAKATSEDIAIRITAWNRGPEPARLHLLPTLWFRNRWDWGDPYDMPASHSHRRPRRNGAHRS